MQIKYEELNFINNLIDLIAQYYNESKLSLIFEKLNGLCNNYIADYFKVKVYKYKMKLKFYKKL